MTKIPRHKAAKTRRQLSPTIQKALAAGILCPGDSILDYGCGKGHDVVALRALGYEAYGYDPYYCPNPQIDGPTDVVSLAYVLNVIEDRNERDRTLVDAYLLAKKALIVSIQIWVEQQKNIKPYGDGKITQWGTFEKYFGCREAREYIEGVLGVRVRRLAQGIFAVDKREARPLVLSYEAEMIEEAIQQQREQLSRLRKECEIQEGAFLERYWTGNRGRIYWRLRSRFGDLPGKNGPCSRLHLGPDGSERHLWGVEQVRRLDEILLLEQRIRRLERVREELANNCSGSQIAV